MLTSPHIYAYGPFDFHSDFPIPELPPASGRGLVVRVSYGPVPASISSPTFHSTYCSASPSEFLLTIPEIARYLVQDGQTITIEADPKAPLLDIRGYLLGSIFAALCHHRRLLPLHASAVRFGDGVVAFLGDSGAGKSTLAASLASAGHPVVADDICLLDPDAHETRRVIPVAPWLKLWRNSLEALGHGAQGLEQVFSSEDKFRLPAAHLPAADSTPLPLKALVVLERRESDDDSTSVAFHPLTAVQAIHSMMHFTCQAYLLDWHGLRKDHFLQCANSLGERPVFTCERAWTLNTLPAVLSQLEALSANDWRATA